MPRDVDRTWDVTATLSSFLREFPSGHELTSVFLWLAHVDQYPIGVADRLLDMITQSADAPIRFCCSIPGARHGRYFGCHRTVLSYPLLTSTIHEPHIAMTIDFQQPKGKCAIPVVRSTIE